MDKIVEEVLTNMIKRIEVIEDKLAKIPVRDAKGNMSIEKQPKKQSKPGMISEGQTNFIKGLEKELDCVGETQYAEMTSKEASDYIEDLLKQKKLKESGKSENLPKKMYEEIAEKDPYLESENKPLTEEEIAEIGEENLL